MTSDDSILETEVAVNLACKLQRTLVALVEALHRYRSGGQQKVVVEHVHVNEGGQAIVGVDGDRNPPINGEDISTLAGNLPVDRSAV